MAAAVRTLKTVRPHIPLIKFPTRGKGPAADSATTSVPASLAVASTPAAESKPVGATPRGSGTDFATLPSRYHRKLLDVEEIEFIERGGPV